METLYVTLYPGPKSIVNGQLLHVYHDRWDVRLSAHLHRLNTVYATFWLDPTPVNCHVRILETTEDPVTGELRASFFAVDLNPEERKRITTALLGFEDYVRLRSVS